MGKSKKMLDDQELATTLVRNPRRRTGDISNLYERLDAIERSLEDRFLQTLRTSLWGPNSETSNQSSTPAPTDHDSSEGLCPPCETSVCVEGYCEPSVSTEQQNREGGETNISSPFRPTFADWIEEYLLQGQALITIRHDYEGRLSATTESTTG